MTGIGDDTQNKQKNTKAENRQDTHTHTSRHSLSILQTSSCAPHSPQRTVSFLFGFGSPLQNLAIIFLRHEGSSHCLVHFQLLHVGCDRLSLNSTLTFLSGDNLLQRILGHILKFRTSNVATLRLASARKDQQLGEIHLQTVHISPRTTPRHDFFAIDRRQCQFCEPSLDSPLRFATLQG